MLGKTAKSVRANILVGFFLVAPLVATVLIFNFLLKLTTNWVPPAVFPVLASVWNGYLLRLIALVALLLVLYIIGLLARNITGRLLYGTVDRILTQIPLVKGVYSAFRRISESLISQRRNLFREVVLVEFPRKGFHSLAFVTSPTPATMAKAVCCDEPKDPCVTVFVPTAPNPTTGFLIIARRSELIPVQIPVTEAMAFIMSAGALVPAGGEPTAGALLERLREWMSEEDGAGQTAEADRDKRSAPDHGAGQQ